MADWVAIDRWPDCRQMERPGIVFEVQNDQGQSVLSACVTPLPTPAGWASPPVRFRAVAVKRPTHSTPIPKAEGAR